MIVHLLVFGIRNTASTSNDHLHWEIYDKEVEFNVQLLKFFKMEMNIEHSNLKKGYYDYPIEFGGINFEVTFQVEDSIRDEPQEISLIKYFAISRKEGE